MRRHDFLAMSAATVAAGIPTLNSAVALSRTLGRQFAIRQPDKARMTNKEDRS